MDFFETVKKRYSYRGQFEEGQLPQEDLDKILEAACLAPTGYNLQTAEIIVCDDKQTKDKLADMFDHDGMRTAPVILVVTSSLKEADGFSFEIQDYASVTEHICLATTALGYATVWTDGDTSDSGRDKEVAKLLNIPEDVTVRAVMPIGKAKEPGQPAKKKGIKELVHFNKY